MSRRVDRKGGCRLEFSTLFLMLGRLRAVCAKTFLHPRVGLALMAGLMLALAFPKFDRPVLAWLAPGCMLLAGLGTSGRRAFGLGYVAGLAHYLLSLHWLLYIPFPAGAVAGWLALSAYNALYPATWVWLCTWALRHLSRPARNVRTQPPGARPGRLEGLFRTVWELTWTQRALWCLTCAAAWIAMEMVLGRLFSGFPWNFLGVSQFKALPLIQVASVTGVYGVSFLVVWCSVALLCTAASVAAGFVRPSPTDGSQRGAASPATPWLSQSGSPVVAPRFAPASDLACPFLTVLILCLGGGMNLLAPPEPGPELQVAVVQPSIPQNLIFDPRESTNRFNKIMELSRLALAAKPDLLVWPEASLPGFDESHYRALTNLVASHRVWMVFGADDAEPNPEAGTAQRRYRYFNSAFLIGPDGRFVATYRKRRLVIFGEYIPLERWLPFTRYFTPIDGSYTPGPGPVWFNLDQPKARLAPLICFEDVFAASARAAVDGDTDFLLNLTNNGWFGESAAQWQQAANAVFRAVENRRPLVRCTNNGLTCWIDALGRLREAGFRGPHDVYGAGFKIFRVPLRSPGANRALTFHQRHGDAFGWTCFGLTLAAAVRLRLRLRG